MPSLLGIHYLGRGADQSLLDAGMRVAKWVSNQPPSNLPVGVWVWRWYRPGDIVTDWWKTVAPNDAARRLIDEQWEHIKFVSKDVAIEGQNEPGTYDGVRGDGQGVLRMRWYAAVEIERMKILESRGYKACIGNFSTGRPDLPSDDGGAILREWEPAMRYAMANGHLFGSHEYGYTIDGFNLGRYQKIYAAMPADARPDYVCTEWGIDGSQGQFRNGAWRSAQLNPDRSYLDLMVAYDALIRRDSFGRGFTVYTSGTNGDPTWNSFDIANQPVVNMARDYIASQRNVVDTPADPLPPPPKFLPGQRIIVNANGILNSRVMPDATTPILSVRQPGDIGTILDGPQANGYAWYDIQWDDGNSGWSIEPRLDKYSDPLPEEPPDEEPPMPTNNLLRNPSFEGGTHEQAGISGVLPDEWDITWADENTPMLNPNASQGEGRQDQVWGIAEITTLTQNRAPDVPVKDGGIFLKIFGDDRPTWATLSQTHNLTPGHYRFGGWVFNDVVKKYKPVKTFPQPGDSPDWYLGSEVRIAAIDNLAVRGDSSWMDARQVPYGTYTFVEIQFDIPTAAACTVSIDVRGRWGHDNVGWFLDDFVLERIGGSTVPPVDPPGTGGALTLAVLRELWTAVGEVLTRYGA